VIRTPTEQATDVLLIHVCSETRGVLATALARRGIRIFATDRLDGITDFLERGRPRVTIVDTDVETADSQTICHALQQAETGNLIVLGQLRWSQSTLPVERVYRKPYHFAPLVRTIESLCAKSANANTKEPYSAAQR
tara:strand:+ start:105 stop:515 length:411 start_codon:yes stop_codon:yes gene_type:complete